MNLRSEVIEDAPHFNIILDNIIFSIQKSGGVSVVWQELINQLYNEGVSPCYIEYEGATQNIFRQMLSLPNEKIDKRSDRFLKLKRYCNPRLGINEPYLFHSSYYRTSDDKRAKNITTVHDFTYEYYMKGIQQKIHSCQKFNAIRKSDAIVCISESTKRDVLKFLPDVDKSKLHVIYNGVSDEYKRLEESPYSSLGDFVLFVGSRVSYKNFDFLVEAMKGVNMKLVIVGSKLTEKEERLLDSNLGKERYVVFQHVSNEELNKIYNAAYCFVYPSSYEGFGIPVLEAQRAGCPVIAFNASSIPEVIGETPLLLNSLNVSEFNKKLAELKSNSIRDEIVKTGLSNSSRFSWERMGKEYMELYMNL